MVAEADQADAAAIGAFMLAAWKAAGPGAPGYSGATDTVMAEVTQEEAVRERIAPPERRMFAARIGGTIVGFAATRQIDGSDVELAGIIVAPHLVGQSIGRRLLGAAVTAATADGRRRMIVHTETDNERALGFYAAHGFIRTQHLVETVAMTDVAVWELARDLIEQR